MGIQNSSQCVEKKTTHLEETRLQELCPRCGILHLFQVCDPLNALLEGVHNSLIKINHHRGDTPPDSSLPWFLEEER